MYHSNHWFDPECSFFSDNMPNIYNALIVYDRDIMNQEINVISEVQ